MKRAQAKAIVERDVKPDNVLHAVPPPSEHRELTERERAFVHSVTRLIVEQWQAEQRKT